MGSMIDVTPLDGKGSFKAYCAEPEGRAAGAIVVIQEIFGINPGIRAMCDAQAAKGYLALAPDLFWQVEPGLELDADDPAQFQQAIGVMQQFDVAAGVRDIEATIREARRRGGGRVGVVGYCLGGRMAYLAATRTDCDAAASYYGGGVDQLLGEARAIGRPLLMHLAQEDHFIDKSAQAAIHTALDGNPHVAIHDYPGVDHAFARAFGKSRDEAAAQLADGRTDAFFREHVGGASALDAA